MRKVIAALLLLPMFASCAFAEEYYEEAAEIIGADSAAESLSGEIRAVSGKLLTDGTYDVRAALKRLWHSFADRTIGELRKELYLCLELIAVGIIFNLALTLCTSGAVKPFMNVCACAAVSRILIYNVEGLISETVKAINSLADYARASMPALFTAAAACGHAGSSCAEYAAVSFAMDMMIETAQRSVVPLVYAYIALALSNSLFPNSLTAGFAKLAKWLAVTLMTGMTIAFTAYINLTGLITGSADAAALKAAKTVISTALPLVGGIASDASSAVLAAAGMVKNSLGVFGLVSAAALCAGPFAAIGVKFLLLKAAAAVTEMLPYNAVSKLISDIGTAVSILLGLLGCCGMMLFISIVAGIKVVTV